MDSKQVSALIQKQIAARQFIPNSHGVELGRCLVEPALIKVTNKVVHKGKPKDLTENVWLVLEEDPVQKNGYKIVFNEVAGKFGLASTGFPQEPYPVLCGYYGDFPTTLESM